jgi:hypothetical protein
MMKVDAEPLKSVQHSVQQSVQHSVQQSVQQSVQHSVQRSVQQSVQQSVLYRVRKYARGHVKARSVAGLFTSYKYTHLETGSNKHTHTKNQHVHEYVKSMATSLLEI